MALTNNCDLRCAHCYAPKHRSTLDKSRVKDWLLEMDSMGVFGIGFGGGEPTLHEDLVELCQFGQEETKLAISFTTHGHSLTPELISQLKSHVNLY
ncbi:radical SAM protein (plasmid) [Vibrio harveyi]|nr:radical SAM protein [Vibrio harveyi]